MLRGEQVRICDSVHPLQAAERKESETTWEEMEFIIGKESNMTATALTLMAIVGVATNALHVVIAGMLIAPGFEPITRISLGVAAGSMGWRCGLVCTAEGYAALTLGLPPRLWC